MCVRVPSACWVCVGCRRVRLGSALSLGSHGRGGVRDPGFNPSSVTNLQGDLTTSPYASVSSLER